MTHEEILADFGELARRIVDFEGEVRPETSLLEGMELDSLGMLTLAIEVENHFRIRLDEKGVATLETVGELVETISRAIELSPERPEGEGSEQGEGFE